MMSLLKVVNINAWLGGKLFPQLLDFLNRKNADVVTMQEVYDGKDESLEERLRTVQVLKQQLNYSYYYFAPTFLDDLRDFKIERGNLILSKYPIKDTKNVYLFGAYGEYSEYKPEQFPIFPRTMQRVIIEFNKSEINVFNLQGIWELGGGDTPQRLKMSEVIVNEIKDKQNVVLCGDFNARPETQTVKNIEQYLVNVFSNDLKSTFNMKRKTNQGYATAVVDMIFVSRNIKVVSKSCPQVDISDHLPLICEFAI